MSTPRREDDPQGWLKYRNSQFSAGVRQLSEAMNLLAESLDSSDYTFDYDVATFITLNIIYQQTAWAANFFHNELEILKSETDQKVIPDTEMATEVAKSDTDSLISDIENWLHDSKNQ